MAPPSRKISAIDFDRVLQHVGPLGPWQYCHAFLLFLVSFLLDFFKNLTKVRWVLKFLGAKLIQNLKARKDTCTRLIDYSRILITIMLRVLTRLV